MIEFPCWGCGKSLKAKEEHAGKQCKCTGCQRENTIPQQPNSGLMAQDEPVEPVLIKHADKTDAQDSSDKVNVFASSRNVVPPPRVDEWPRFVNWLRNLLSVILAIALTYSLFRLIGYVGADCTVPTYEIEAVNRATGYPRVFNHVNAHEQLAGIHGHGLLVLSYLGILFIIRPASAGSPAH